MLGIDRSNIFSREFVNSKGTGSEPGITISRKVHNDLRLLHVSFYGKEEVVHYSFRNDAGTDSKPKQMAASKDRVMSKQRRKPTFRETINDVSEKEAQLVLVAVKERGEAGSFEKRIDKSPRLLLLKAA